MLPELAPCVPDAAEPRLTKTLHAAAREGDVRTLLALVKLGVPINERATSLNWTAIHVAAAFNHAFAVAALLHHGADPNTQDIDGDTPLITAASLGHREAVQQLLAGKTDVMVTSPTGETALHAAAESGCVDVASVLIAHGGVKLVGVQNKNGMTAYDMASGDSEIKDMIIAIVEEESAD